ncbi:MAG: aminopeptidase [Desulfomonilaceae bacterium]|nr:aminopeptidase [Desulfomonilaceae bacterium]
MPENKPSEKTRKLKEDLFWEQQRCWDKLSARERAEVSSYAERYIDFLDRARTERRAVKLMVEEARLKGFNDIHAKGAKTGRVFLSSREKMLVMAVVGKRPMAEGIRLVASHLDAPRLDLKPNPLYEDTGLAFLKTHYYGGIKKYHWVARPLALCGTLIRRDGRSVDIDLGLEPDDPILTVTDLLPHLARKQMEQKASEFIPAENLNVLVGGTPYADKKADERVKLSILQILNKKYKITEEDFTTAEIQVVPADRPRSAGLDGSLIAGYGQDDRVCAFTSFSALLETAQPEHTCVAVFYDKEEIGSEGNTSAKSRFLEMFLMEMLQYTGAEPSQVNLHRVCFNGKGLSADVAAGLDPTYPDVHEKRNSPKLGCGLNLKKYTGSGGKYGASDANAEYASWVRNLFNDNRVVWQAGGMGKVDEGGGGTVSKFVANLGMEIIDCGPPVLSMHSPLEVTSKDDVWMCRKAFKVFFMS